MIFSRMSFFKVFFVLAAAVFVVATPIEVDSRVVSRVDNGTALLNILQQLQKDIHAQAVALNTTEGQANSAPIIANMASSLTTAAAAVSPLGGILGTVGTLLREIIALVIQILTDLGVALGIGSTLADAVAALLAALGAGLLGLGL